MKESTLFQNFHLKMQLKKKQPAVANICYPMSNFGPNIPSYSPGSAEWLSRGSLASLAFHNLIFRAAFMLKSGPASLPRWEVCDSDLNWRKKVERG